MKRTALRRVATIAPAILAALGVAAAAGAVVVLVLGRVPNTGERAVFVAWTVAAIAAMLCYTPARRGIERAVASIPALAKGSPEDLVRRFSGSLSRSEPLDELLLQLVETLHAELSLASAEVWTGSGGVLERTASLPDRPRETMRLTPDQQSVVASAGASGAEWARVWLPGLAPAEPFRVVPASNAGELLGLIVVRGTADRATFDANEERALAELGRHVGLALRNVRLDSQLQSSLEELRAQTVALQASRRRLVAAADTERRRLERDLHDGAQQHLVALGVNVQVARAMLAKDPEKAATMLDELAGSIQATVEELRALAHGIYPPLLADRGLGDALAAAARRSPMKATVDAKRLKRYPPEIESAAYYCALEALQNAAKHAGDGASATVRVREEAGALRFDVADDGVGFDPDAARRGAGFANMSDRLGAIGGSLRIESAPGEGTVVSGTIPLPRR